MSSDFCLEYFSIDENKEADWTAAREVIEKMAKVHISKWKALIPGADFEYFFDRYEEACLEYEDEIQPDMNDRIRVCEMLIEQLRRVRQAWEGETRDSVSIQMRGRHYLFTGGMSNGDEPTDTYESIGKLLPLKILQAAGFEDH